MDAARSARKLGQELARQQADEEVEIGARLRALRGLYGLSQRELARRTGVANGTVSSIESGSMNPSLASLKKILGAFPITLTEFFTRDLDEHREIFFRRDELPEIAEEGISFLLVRPSVREGKLQLMRERYAPGSDTGAEMLTHAGEEAGIVIRGRIEITVGARCRELGPGDAYYFESRLPHRFRNRRAVECEIVSVSTPPTF